MIARGDQDSASRAPLGPVPRYLISAEEVAFEFKVSLTRARELLRSGDLGRAFKRGKRVHVLRTDFEKALLRMASRGC